MRKIVSSLLLFFSIVFANAQDQSFANSSFHEVQNAVMADTALWNKKVLAPQFLFASGNVRYAKEKIPEIFLTKDWQPKAWKGERIHTQLLFFSNENASSLNISVSDLTAANGSKITTDAITTGFIRYVKTDVFSGGCGVKNNAQIDSSIVEDIIDNISQLAYQKYTTQPIWLSIQVPQNIAAGTYKGTITINGTKKHSLSFSVEVQNRTLPTADKWSFDLDLWQHPYAVARVHGVKPWSDEHFSLMKKYYTMLAKAGQKVITASIINEAWNHQTYDDYPSLIKWIKHKNGTWSYDYSLFDKYIQFVMDCGINKRINCYSMIPWKINFEYFDEASGKKAYITDSPGSTGYNLFWGEMLKDFRKHLIQKGWFEKTAIAMDERALKDMQAVIKLVKGIDKNFKISLAGDYHAEIEPFISDYCVASKWIFPDTVLAKRKKLNQPSTVYTCCTEAFPNGFTFSPPAENAWLPWFAAAKGFTGYVRWAYNSWVSNPLIDSRFTTWPGGDTYQVYPGPRTSIRFEKLVEGIQDFEKINLLKEEFIKQKKIAELQTLNNILKPFSLDNLTKTTAQEILEKAKKQLEGL